MGKEGRSPWASGHSDCHRAAVRLLPPHPLSPRLTGAGAPLGRRQWESPGGPVPVPAALHVNLGADATIASPSFVPEERGARRRDPQGRGWLAVRGTRS